MRQDSLSGNPPIIREPFIVLASEGAVVQDLRLDRIQAGKTNLNQIWQNRIR